MIKRKFFAVSALSLTQNISTNCLNSEYPTSSFGLVALLELAISHKLFGLVALNET